MSTYYENITFDDHTLGWVYKFSDYQYDFYDIHWHRDVELVYMLKGVCKTTVNGQVSHLHAGDVLLINSGNTHYFNLNNDGDVCDALTIIFPYALFLKICPSFDQMYFVLDTQEPHFEKFSRLLKKTVEIFESTKYKDLGYLRINSIIYELIYILLTYYCHPLNPAYMIKTASSRGLDRCKSILKYLDENYKNDISLESASQYCNMSREYIARTMKEHLGMTFKQYLTDIRLTYAHLRLSETQDTVLQISMDSGFPNCKAFITAFSRKYSATPQLYRKLYLGIK